MASGLYSINPVLSGLLDGVQIANAIKQSQLEQQSLELQKQRQQRQAQIEDLQTRMGLQQSGGKPLQQGQTTTPATAHTPGVNINGIEVGGSDQQTAAPIDPSQVLSYQGQRWLMPTPNEQFQTRLSQEEAEQAVKAKGAIALHQGTSAIDLNNRLAEQNNQNGFENQRLDKTLQAGRERDQWDKSFQGAENQKNRDLQTNLTNVREGGENKRSAANNATQLKVAGMRTGEDGLTANGVGVESRFDAKLAAQEQEVHEMRRAIGNALMTADDEEYVDPSTKRDVTMSPSRRKWLQGLMKSYDDKLAGVQAARQRAAELMGKGKGNRQPAAAAQAPAAGAIPQVSVAGANPYR